MSDAPQTAVVTGAASGLGRALAVRLARDGRHIALADIDTDGCEETRKLVAAAGGAGRVEHMDVSRLTDWESLRERLRHDWPRLDLLVNNAGVAGAGDVGVFPLNEWNLLLGVDLYGAIHGCHTLIDWLKENPTGAHVVNIASFAAMAPSPSMAAYNAAKAGLVALSETLYGELKPHGVGVTVACPMFFPTNINQAARYYNDVRADINREGTEKATLTAEELAEMVMSAVRRKQLYLIPGRQTRWYWFLRRLTPRAFLDGMAADFERRSHAQAESDGGTREL